MKTYNLYSDQYKTKSTYWCHSVRIIVGHDCHSGKLLLNPTPRKFPLWEETQLNNDNYLLSLTHTLYLFLTSLFVCIWVQYRIYVYAHTYICLMAVHAYIYIHKYYVHTQANQIKFHNNIKLIIHVHEQSKQKGIVTWWSHGT